MSWTLLPRAFMTAAAICAVVGLGSTPLAAQAKSEVTVSVLSAPFGTASYILSTAYEQISKNHPWLRIVASESPGYVFNVKKLDAEPELAKNTMVGSGPALLRLAAEGAKPFAKKHKPLKLIGNQSIVAVWMASLDAGLKGGSDAAAKRMAFGQSAQINWAVLPRAVVENGWGVTNARVQYLEPKSAVSALLDGKADLAIVGGYVDPASGKIALAPPTLELVATGRKLNHLHFSKEAVEKTVAKGYEMTPYTVPAGTAPSIDSPIHTFVDTSAWTVDESFPEDVAYEAAKLLINNIDKFGEVHAIGKLMSGPGLIYGWKADDIHPGALRAYKEAGIMK